mmetsp:Transcript_3268/g.9466  ORF Transcript_3268/g.9466 Transcript_3268/m.9466 type:complete len:268 (+) Transcript_3268:135-938(+)
MASRQRASTLPEMVADTPCFDLQPRAFLVAWSGVLTCAFAGWPAPVATLKSRIDAEHADAMDIEAPGSKFPKVTLAALREGRAPLSEMELRALLAAAEECSRSCLASSKAPPMRVSSLAVTLWQCGSHERLLSRHDMALRDAKPGDDTSGPDASQQAYVSEVLAETTDPVAYLPMAQRPGDIRRYREVRSWPGSSLVAFVGGLGLDDALVTFRERVEAAVGPDVYEWMSPAALHCTIRALSPAAPPKEAVIQDERPQAPPAAESAPM